MIHLTPDDAGRTRCCGKTVTELPLSDEFTLDEGKKTCPKSGYFVVYGSKEEQLVHLTGTTIVPATADAIQEAVLDPLNFVSFPKKTMTVEEIREKYGLETWTADVAKIVDYLSTPPLPTEFGETIREYEKAACQLAEENPFGLNHLAKVGGLGEVVYGTNNPIAELPPLTYTTPSPATIKAILGHEQPDRQETPEIHSLQLNDRLGQLAAELRQKVRRDVEQLTAVSEPPNS
mgnify:CR=1 FL=1